MIGRTALAIVLGALPVAAATTAVTATATQTRSPSAGDDWPDAVRKAVEHRRYAVRRAVAGKLAEAGDAAVGAIEAYAARHGHNALPLTLVDAIARETSRGPETIALLARWAGDRDFYWRSQALDGLARRGSRDCLERFRAAVADPSHLFRIAGARGLLAVGGDADRQRVRALLRDTDPRVRLRVGLLLLEDGDPVGIGEILAALQRDARFLDDPWGERDALLARRELERISGEDFGLDAADPTERAAAQVRLRAWAAERCGAEVEIPAAPRAIDSLGGIEVRSCRDGDLFLRWTTDGTIFVGLDPLRRLSLGEAARERLRSTNVGIDGTAVHGPVVCDYIRVLVRDPLSHHKAAPGRLPAALDEWLKELRAAIEESGETELAAHIDGHLQQFAPSGK